MVYEFLNSDLAIRLHMALIMVKLDEQTNECNASGRALPAAASHTSDAGAKQIQPDSSNPVKPLIRTGQYNRNSDSTRKNRSTNNSNRFWVKSSMGRVHAGSNWKARGIPKRMMCACARFPLLGRER